MQGLCGRAWGRAGPQGASCLSWMWTGWAMGTEQHLRAAEVGSGGRLGDPPPRGGPGRAGKNADGQRPECPPGHC